MRQTLAKYRARLCSGEVHPVAHWDGTASKLIFDPRDEQTPLSLLGFGVCRLRAEPHRLATEDREYALVPLQGDFEIRIGPEVMRGRRESPWATRPGRSNAWAIYAPPGAAVELTGRGELIYYSAPTQSAKRPGMVKPGDRADAVYGSGVWLREAVVLLSPENLTTSLVVGETYSPPGLWSGTPLHVHDADDPQAGQSDHEEVYFHIARPAGGSWGPYSLQMLFDAQGLNNAYVIHDHDAVAIAGGAHPVVAGPACELLYTWGLAGTGASLRMWDVPEFAFLKIIGKVLDQLAKTHPRPVVSAGQFERIVREHAFSPEQAHVLRMHLKQQGFEIQR